MATGCAGGWDGNDNVEVMGCQCSYVGKECREDDEFHSHGLLPCHAHGLIA